MEATALLNHTSILLLAHDRSEAPSQFAAMLGFLTSLLAAYTAIPKGDVPVSIQVKCMGVDWNKLSFGDRTYTGHLLQDTFNELHEELDDGDQHLDAIHPVGGLFASGDDLESFVGTFEGGFGCSSCSPDDDLLFVAGSGSALKAWGKRFVASMIASNHPVFSQAKSCKITMGPGKDEPSAGADLGRGKKKSDGAIDLIIAPYCPDLEAYNLSMSEITYTAHALEESFNDVHMQLDDGDQRLDGVHPVSASELAALTKDVSLERRGSFYFVGGYSCTTCDPDDDMLSVMASGKAKKAWEKSFDALLMEYGIHGDCNCVLDVKYPSQATLKEAVSMELDCNGLFDSDVATLAALTKATEALESTFNAVGQTLAEPVVMSDTHLSSSSLRGDKPEWQAVVDGSMPHQDKYFVTTWESLFTEAMASSFSSVSACHISLKSAETASN